MCPGHCEDDKVEITKAYSAKQDYPSERER